MGIERMITKLIEKLLMNKLLYGNIKYNITELFNGKEESWSVDNLKAYQEDGTLWFNNDYMVGIIIDKIENISIEDQEIKINLIHNNFIKIAR